MGTDTRHQPTPARHRTRRTRRSTGRRARAGVRGFTLVEALITLVIVGILAGIATPFYLGHLRRTYEAGLLVVLHNAMVAGDAYASAHAQSYTGLTLGQLGVSGYRRTEHVTTRVSNAGPDDFCVQVSDERLDGGATWFSRTRKSAAVESRICPVPPPARPAVTARATGPDTATLTWSTPEEAVRTELWRCLGPACDPADGTLLGTFTATSSPSMTDAAAGFADTGLVAGTYYRYALVADNRIDWTGGRTWSDPAPLRWTRPAPGKPDLSAAATDATTVTLTWTVPFGTVTQTVRRCTGVVCDPAHDGAEIASVGASVATLPDGGRDPGTTYRYQVTADNTIGVTGGTTSSDVVSIAYTLAAPPKPALAAVMDLDTAQLTWTIPPGARTVEIRRCAGPGCDPLAGTSLGTFPAAPVSGAPVTALADPGRTVGVRYRYIAVADNRIGTTGGTSAGEPVEVVYTPTPPGVPTVTATPRDAASVTVTVAVPRDATSVIVLRCVGDECDPLTGTTLTTRATTPTTGTVTITDTGLSAGTTYRYVAVAVNLGGRTPGPAVSAVPSAGPFQVGLFGHSWIRLRGYDTLGGGNTHHAVTAATNGAVSLTVGNGSQRIDRISFYGPGTAASRCSGTLCPQTVTDQQGTQSPVWAGSPTVAATLAACRTAGPLPAFTGSSLAWRTAPYCFSSFTAKAGFTVTGLTAPDADPRMTVRVYVDGPVTFAGDANATGFGTSENVGARLVIFSTGTSVSLPSSGVVAAGVWAPNAACANPVNTGGSNGNNNTLTVVGSLVCDTLDLSKVRFWFSPMLATRPY